jgi:hypothetical protein
VNPVHVCFSRAKKQAGKKTGPVQSPLETPLPRVWQRLRGGFFSILNPDEMRELEKFMVRSNDGGRHF